MNTRLGRSAVKTNHSAHIERWEREARHKGYAKGWSRGYRLGRSQAIMEKVSASRGLQRIRDIHVLFVAEDYEGGQFHKPINDGIIAGLQCQVRQVSVALPTDNIDDLAKQYRPDMVLVLNGIFHLSVEQIVAIRSRGITTCLWISEDPYFIDISLPRALLFDYVFTHELNAVSCYQAAGCRKVYYLPLAVNESLFRPKQVSEAYSRDICFIGTAFWNRVRFFDAISSYVASKKTLISGLLWDRLAQYRQLGSKVSLERCMSTEDTAAYYNASSVVINLHRSHEDDQHNYNKTNVKALSVNPRTFDICACGALQLTDVRDDLTRFYTPGEEIVTYSSPEELVSKCEYYLTHENERREIALRGLEKTMREHTYTKRLSRLLEVLYG